MLKKELKNYVVRELISNSLDVIFFKKVYGGNVVSRH
jgi:hypothetical protein